MFRLFVPIFITALFLALVCLVPTMAQATVSPVAGTDYRRGLEQETFSLINQYRKAHDLPSLQWDGKIAEVARGHSREMASNDVDFGHDGFSERVASLKTAMPDLRGAGENVLKTDDPNDVARRAVTIWLHSPHHLENIRGDFNYSGMGIWVDKLGTIYFTQIFVKTVPKATETTAQTPAQIDPPVNTPFGLLATPKTRSQP